MKRSPFPPPDPARRLSRRVPLKSTGGLGQGSGPVRQARIRQVSVKAAEKPRRQAKDTGPSRKVRALVMAREGNCCAACGVSVIGRPYSVQHRVARGMGGTSRPEANSPERLVLLCGTAVTGCHGLAERRDPEMRARGFWLNSWEDPESVPVMLASEHDSGMTVWLTPDGEYAFEPPAVAA